MESMSCLLGEKYYFEGEEICIIDDCILEGEVVCMTVDCMKCAQGKWMFREIREAGGD